MQSTKWVLNFCNCIYKPLIVVCCKFLYLWLNGSNSWNVSDYIFLFWCQVLLNSFTEGYECSLHRYAVLIYTDIRHIDKWFDQIKNRYEKILTHSKRKTIVRESTRMISNKNHYSEFYDFKFAFELYALFTEYA